MISDEARHEAAAMLAFLREHGWCKHVLRDENGRACLVGASACRQDQDMSDIWDYSLVHELIVSIIRSEFPDRIRSSWSDAVDFNNHPDTTFTDIEMVLEKVIAS